MDNPLTPPEARPDSALLEPVRAGLGGVRALAARAFRGVWGMPVTRQLTRFTGVGIVCTVSSLALYAVCRPFLGAQAANAVALIVTSVMNTALNRRYTFKVRGPGRLAQDHLNGLVALAVALVLTAGSLAGLHWLNPSADVAAELWTTTIAGWVATAVRFSLLRHWIFRRARDA